MDQHFNINFLYCFIHADSSFKNTKAKTCRGEVCMWEHVYPFSAIVGQDAMKKSLLLNIINPQIGGVLICGQKGTANRLW